MQSMIGPWACKPEQVFDSLIHSQLLESHRFCLLQCHHVHIYSQAVTLEHVTQLKPG